MITFPSRHELAALRTFSAPHCVTIYAPLLESTGATNPNRVELKNQLRQAKIALRDSGVRDRDITATLQPAHDLADGSEFWPPSHASLVLFMHATFFRYYHLPDHTTPYLLTVDRGFNLGPLLSAMHHTRSYYVLALGHRDVRLYEGDRYRLRPVTLSRFPASMLETLRIDENLDSRELHPVAPAYMGHESKSYHSQYDVSLVDKARLEEFFRVVDHRLHHFLMSSHRPLILGGVSYELSLYRKVNTYPYLWPESIRRNLQDEPLQVIRDQAWATIAQGGTL